MVGGYSRLLRTAPLLPCRSCVREASRSHGSLEDGSVSHLHRRLRASAGVDTVRREPDRDKGLTSIRSLHRKPCPAKGLTGPGGPDAVRSANLTECDSSR